MILGERGDGDYSPGLAQDPFRVKTKSNLAISAPRLVNAAGLYAHKLTERMFDVYDTVATPTRTVILCAPHVLWLEEGRSHSVQAPRLPSSARARIGSTRTRDVNGVCKFGPDIEWIDDIDYTMKVAHGPRFSPLVL